MGGDRATVRVLNIPLTAVAAELFAFFDSTVGSIYACEIATARRNWKSRGFGRVQFDSASAAERACALAAGGRIPAFQGALLDVLRSNDDIVVRAADFRNRVEASEVHVGVLVSEREMEVFDSWENVRVDIMPERKRLDLYVQDDGNLYKLEVMFSDIVSWLRCSVNGGQSMAMLLQLKYAPRIFIRLPEQMPSLNLSDNRYSAFTEDFKFTWNWWSYPFLRENYYYLHLI